MKVKNRLIPVLHLKNGLLVRSESFKIHQIIGNPFNEAKRFNEWNVDELIYLDITRDGESSTGRVDTKYGDVTDPLDILEAVSKTCFMPLTWGGRIRTLQDMHLRFSRGADKVVINSQALANPSIIDEAAKTFGSQAIVVSIDAKLTAEGLTVFANRGQTNTHQCPIAWAREAQARGAGEILIQNIDRDGKANGYDTQLIGQISTAVSIPVIACSGVGSFDDYAAGIKAGAAAVAAANIWHFKELTDRHGKRALHQAGINVRWTEAQPHQSPSSGRRRRRQSPTIPHLQAA